MMKTETVDCFALESDQESLEHINPGERAFTDEPALVYSAIEMAFSPTFHRFSIALVLSNVGNNPAVP
jgi:hypothetical protein